MPAADLKRLRDAADKIEKYIVNPRVHDIEISFISQVFYLLALLFLGIIANSSPNTGTLIGTLGLGTLGVAGNYQRIQKAVDKLLRDKRALKDFVGNIRIQIAVCDKNDAQAIAEIRVLIQEALERLNPQ